MSAGFRYTPSGGSQKTMVLARPLSFQRSAAHRRNRWAVDSLDYSAREVISIATGRAEVQTTIRFQKTAQDLLDMLRYAADGVVLSYFPDLSINTSYDLWLVGSSDVVELAPMSGRWPFGEYEVTVRFRDASSSGAGLEALFSPWLFRYDAGMAAPGMVVSRTGTLLQRGQFGVLESVAANLPRDGDWLDLDGDGVLDTPTLLVEKGATNLVTSDDLTAWSSTGTPVVTPGITDPAGGTGAYRVADDDGAAIENKYRSVTFTGDGTKAIAFYVREATMPASGTQVLYLRDATAAVTRGQVSISGWVGGEPTLTANFGTLIGKRYVGGGYWGVYLRATGVVAANSNRAVIEPASTAASTGSIDVYRVNVYDISDNGLPVYPLDASAVQDHEEIYAPVGFGPQDLTFYTDFIEYDSPSFATDSGASLRIVQIGSEANGNPRLGLYKVAGGDSYGFVYNDGIGSDALSTVDVSPVFGSRIEVCGVLSGGAVTLSAAKARGSVSSGSTSTALTYPSAWSASRCWLGGLGDLQGRGRAGLISVKIAAGSQTLAAMRAL